MQPSEFEFGGCYARFERLQLVIGNTRIERGWDLSYGVPITLSLLNKTDGTEWIDADPGRRARACGLPLWNSLEEVDSIRVSFDTDDDLGIGAEHLRTTVLLNWGDREMKLEFAVYPDKPWIRQRIWVREATGDGDFSSSLEASGEIAIVNAVPLTATSAVVGPGMQLDDNAKTAVGAAAAGDADNCLDALPIGELHARWEAVELRDVTDTNNNLVSFEQGMLYTNEKRKIRGNLMKLERTLERTGLWVVKEGPTPYGHLHYPGGDFEFTGRVLRVIGCGIAASDLRNGEWIPAYGSSVGVWTGGELESWLALDDLHRAIRCFQPARDYFLMCNNWGDRSKDGRVSEKFIQTELERAAELGITNYQIDDGWQHGNTTNSVNPAGGRWSDYYADGDGFWNVHPERFPNGFEPLKHTVERNGLRLALWFSPDSANDFANWDKDVERLLELHRDYGVCYFKLDGIKIKSKYGETNLVRMMQRVVRESGGRVYFNVDATNQVRLGYYGRNQYGGLFVENRYTDFRSYYPHWTLRNLWLLSKYVPAQKLQMEFLNVDRNRHVYGENDPLSPYKSGIAYAFAVTMFTNPLVWMELTGLSADNRVILKRMLDVYNLHLASVLDGRVLPIGDTPDGAQWTGLQSVKRGGEGYLLVIRERHSLPSKRMPIWGLEADGSVGERSIQLTPLLTMESRNEVIANGGGFELAIDEDGRVRFELAAPFSFGFYHYRVRSSKG
ncbi:alpha-galactosidase [Paenibacillus koleovorans]|uniref:alpha-galactosidase n=1 Tax=Paenibacillus koleovorans TaxID=121608 RepID=UPI000FD8DD5C|nr:alpha-galactosidase [Paenibacillus koleovorans]